MAATLIAVVVALSLGHGVPSLAELRGFDWLGRWARWLHAQLASTRLWRGGWALLPLLGLPVAVLLLVQTAIAGWLFGLLGFAFAVAVLFYCWGPRDLDVDVEAVIEASDAQARRHAAQALWPHGRAANLEGPLLVEAVFRGALRRWFGVLLWFLLLGPAGALLYRLTALAAESEYGQSLEPGIAGAAGDLLRILDWPAAQLMTLGLALVGNFDAVFNAWREWHAGGWRLETGFLDAAARASVACELAEQAEEDIEAGEVVPVPALLELRDAMSLVWRILLVWLAVLALFVLAGWVN